MALIQLALPLLVLPTLSPPPVQDDGLVRVRSRRGVAETAAALDSALAARRLTVFAKVDHAANARSAGLELRPTTLYVFGNPAVGTRLMQCVQTAGIDLPLRMLVWEDDRGVAWVGYVDPSALAARHGLADCRETLELIRTALASLAAGAAGGP